MPSWSALDTLVTPAGTLTFNEASGDTYVVDPARSTGIGMAKVRAPFDKRGQTSGYVLHPFFQEGRKWVIVGRVHIPSGSVATRDAMTDDMEAKLVSILQADGTLSFSGGPSYTVRCFLEADFPSAGGIHKDFIFGVVSESS